MEDIIKKIQDKIIHDREYDKYILIISIIALVVGILYYFFLPQQNVKPLRSEKEQFFAQGNIIYVPKSSDLINGPAYNYTNMIDLIKGYRFIEQEFYSNFDSFTKNQNNLPKLQAIFYELKRERAFFRRYLQKVKAYYKRYVPTKKHNALRYYFRVLDNSIDDLDEMIEKFKYKISH